MNSKIRTRTRTIPRHDDASCAPPAVPGERISAVGSLVGSGVQVGVVAPEHVLAQLGADGLHLVLGQLGALGVEEGAAVLVLCNPAAGERAVLDIVQNCLHIGLGLLIVAGLLALVSFSLINNIIRMSVYARRYSIHTMKLVGASWSFIRRPFIVQALRIGIVAAIIACGLLGGMIYYLQFEAGAGDIYINQLITPEVWIYTLGVIVVCGICLTAWSAYLSVNHHLSLRGGEVYVR